MGNERNLFVVASSSVVLYVKYLGDRIFPLLRDFSRYPNVGKDVVKALGECGVVDCQELGLEVIWPNNFPT